MNPSPPPTETTATGKAVGVDKDKLIFTADGKQRTVAVPAVAEVRIDGKDGTLAEVRKDAAVTVTTRGDVVFKVDAKNLSPAPTTGGGGEGGRNR